MNYIKEKKQLIEKLFEKKNEYTKKSIEYKKTKCKIMLKTDFKDVLNSARPTVDEKKAYIASKTLEIRLEKEMLYNEVEYLKYQITLFDDLINQQ